MKSLEEVRDYLESRYEIRYENSHPYGWWLKDGRLAVLTHDVLTDSWDYECHPRFPDVE